MADMKKKIKRVRSAYSGTPKKVTDKFSIFGSKRSITDEVEKKKQRIKTAKRYS
jgi:hypothetical protein